MIRAPGAAATALGAGFALAPAAASAHAAERMVILTLPVGYYFWGAAAAVAVTAVMGVLSPRLPEFPAVTLWTRRQRRLPSAPASWTSFALLAGLVATGLLGSRDPLTNPLSVAIWVGLWVALPLVTIVLGDAWRGFDPWTGPVRAARSALGRSGGLGLGRLGAWPAVAAFLAFAWFEIVSPAPADPGVLAQVVALYWMVYFCLAVAEGDDWLRRGEAFSVYFGLLARIAPLWRKHLGDTVALRCGWPGTQVLRMAPLGTDLVAFVTLVLAALAFDGLSETFWWLARIGVNPLEFPGRSAVIGINTAGLLAAWAVAAAAVVGTIELGRRLGGAPGSLREAAGLHVLAFLPISAGFHVAHYLVALLTQGQYAIMAINDPFGRHWHLLSLPDAWASFGFLNDPVAVRAIWNVQFALVLGAHLLAVVLGLKLSARDAPRHSWRAHLPMTVLMVLFTVFGLWLLSTATGA